MMRPALTGLLSLLSTPLLLAQGELRIADFGNNPMTWGQTSEEATTALRYDELPGEFTVLMVHTTVDESVCGPIVAAGITSALPFMEMPGDHWQLTDPHLTAEPDVIYTGQQPKVPPRRIANYVNHYVGLNYPTGYGTQNGQGTTWLTREMDSTVTALPLNSADERNPWWYSTWSTEPQYSVTTFETAQLGRESVLQAAYEYVPLVPGTPPLDENSIAILNSMMDSTIGFEIYIQAIHIKKPDPQGEIIVRVSRHVRVRRRSLGQQTTGWAAIMGPERHVPNPLNANERIYLAPFGEQMHVQFPNAVASTIRPRRMRAHFPLVGGGFRTVLQEANPLAPSGEILDPWMTIFPVPSDAAWGPLFFTDVDAPLVRVAPVGASASGAAIPWYYVVPAATPAQPAPPTNN